MQNYDSADAAPRMGAYVAKGLISSPAPKTALTAKPKHNPAKNLGKFHHKPKAKRAG